MFQDGVASCSYVLAQIKAVSWRWFVYREGRNTGFVFSDWCNCPMGSLHGLY